MKILVCGDSWAADHANLRSWTQKLGELLHCHVDSFAQHGCSNYLILQQYLNNCHNGYDVAIIIKTSMRIPIVNGFSHLCSYMPNQILTDENKNPIKNPELVQAFEHYLKYFYNEDFLSWVTEKTMEEIALTRPPNQKIIWIKGFDDTIHQEEIPDKSIVIEGDLYNDVFDTRTDFIDHLSVENNYNLAAFLKDVIIDPNANKNLKKHTWTFT